LAIVYYWVQKSTVAEPVKVLTSGIKNISGNIYGDINPSAQVALRGVLIES